jgi:LEA14-like dessication related protein
MKKIKNLLHFNSLTFLFLWLLPFGCAPKEPVEFKGIKNIAVDISNSGSPVLKADVNFHNPNRVKMKLKGINVEVFVDGVKSADVKHELDVVLGGQSDFSVPIVAQLSLKQNLLDAVVGLLGGKKYQVVFKGYIRLRVHGVVIKIPVSQNQELKLNI